MIKIRRCGEAWGAWISKVVYLYLSISILHIDSRDRLCIPRQSLVIFYPNHDYYDNTLWTLKTISDK